MEHPYGTGVILPAVLLQPFHFPGLVASLDRMLNIYLFTLVVTSLLYVGFFLPRLVMMIGAIACTFAFLNAPGYYVSRTYCQIYQLFDSLSPSHSLRHC